MVAQRQGEVGAVAVVGDVGVDGEVVACARAKVGEQFGDALLTLRVLAEWVNDLDLAGSDSGHESGRFIVAWDELNVLNTGIVGDGYRVNNPTRGEFPDAECIRFLDAVDRRCFEDGKWDNKVRG